VAAGSLHSVYMGTSDLEDRRRLALELYHHGLEAVVPAPAVQRALATHPLATQEGIRVAAMGKAAAGMLDGAIAALGERISRSLVATPVPLADGQTSSADVFVVGGHPLPDEGSLEAGQALLDLVQSGDGPLLVLLSGGASACVEVPRWGVELTALRDVNKRLLEEELDIAAVNAVRSGYSKIKDGGLLQWVDPARTWVLVVSDVGDDDPSIIGSGLLHPDPTRRANAESLSAALGLPRPPKVRAPEVVLPADHTQLVLRAAHAVRAMKARADLLAHPVQIMEQRFTGSVAQAGLLLADRIMAGDGIILGCGECIVRLPAHPGRGGRCQQLALSAAGRLAGAEAALLAAGSDGTDGPDGAAGALVDGGTWQRVRDAGLDPADALSGADSGSALAAAGDLIDTGPTGTNVGDLFVGIPAAICRG
jgi:glycerate 2-kinase